MFANLLRYCGDAPGMDVPNQVQAVEIAQKLLHQGLKRGELKEELYMQLVKQTRCNPFPASRIRAWDMFNMVASAMPPSKVSYEHGCKSANGWVMAKYKLRPLQEALLLEGTGVAGRLFSCNLPFFSAPAPIHVCSEHVLHSKCHQYLPVLLHL
jgi:hypothetical protein